MIVFGGITNEDLSEIIVDSCRVCNFRINTNLILCVQCGKWIHGRFA